MLAWYLSRRIVRPILQLSDSVDAVAAGRYTSPSPTLRAVGSPQRSIGEMAHRLGRGGGDGAEIPHVGLARVRTPLTAIRGHVSALLDEASSWIRSHVTSRSKTVEAEAQTAGAASSATSRSRELDTHRFMVLTEEVDNGAAARPGRSSATAGGQRRRSTTADVRDRPVIISDGDPCCRSSGTCSRTR